MSSNGDNVENVGEQIDQVSKAPSLIRVARVKWRGRKK